MKGRYFVDPEVVTPQSYLADEYRKAKDCLERKRRAARQVAIEVAEKKFGIRELIESIKKAAGYDICITYPAEPATNSPMGQIIEKAVAKFDTVDEDLHEAYRDASLRVSLGKGVDEKLAQLKEFSRLLTKILAKLD